MATEAECAEALDRLSQSLRKLGEAGSAAIDERTVSCTVTDIDVVFVGRLDSLGFHDITTATSASAPAQIRLELTSDDLVALSNRELDFPKAWARGRIRVHASFGDILRLRKFF